MDRSRHRISSSLPLLRKRQNKKDSVSTRQSRPFWLLGCLVLCSLQVSVSFVLVEPNRRVVPKRTSGRVSQSFLSSRSNEEAQQLEHVWIWEDDEKDPFAGSWKSQSTLEAAASRSITETAVTLVQNWCQNFVLELDLCPWAKASLQTRGAMRFFLVPPPIEMKVLEPRTGEKSTSKDNVWDAEEWRRMEGIVESASQRFQAEILNPVHQDPVLEKAAIYFVVFLNHGLEGNDDGGGASAMETFPMLPPTLDIGSNDFFGFVEWFQELEDMWPEELDDVTIAPFHHDWSYGTDDGEDEDGNGRNPEVCMDYEKKSPYPIVTLVSTRVIEQAGAPVTEAIGRHNQEILMGIDEELEEQCRKQQLQQQHENNTTPDAKWAQLWESAVCGTTHESSNEAVAAARRNQ